MQLLDLLLSEEMPAVGRQQVVRENDDSDQKTQGDDPENPDRRPIDVIPKGLMAAVFLGLAIFLQINASR